LLYLPGMARYARWFTFVGVMAALPAALLLGLSAGELLRRPSAGIEALVEREGIVLLLALAAVFCLRTAAGLREERAWALHLAMALAVCLALAGVAALLVGGALLEGIGVDRQFVISLMPVSLAAILFGTRLLVGLWPLSALPQPFAWRDLRAIGTLVAVLGAAVLGHVVVSGLAA
jgi:hypothetical protein